MHSLTDKRVLITGGGSGIGRSLALRFAREGAELHLADLDPGAAGAVARAITSEGGKARAWQLDVTNAGAIADLRRRLLAESGPIDVLVNNAGIVHGGAFLDVPLERHVATFEVNTLAVVAVTHAFLPDSGRAPRGAHRHHRERRGLHRPAIRQHLRREQVGRDRLLGVDTARARGTGPPARACHDCVPGLRRHGIVRGCPGAPAHPDPDTRAGGQSRGAGGPRESRDGDDAVGGRARAGDHGPAASPRGGLGGQAVRRADEPGGVAGTAEAVAASDVQAQPLEAEEHPPLVVLVSHQIRRIPTDLAKLLERRGALRPVHQSLQRASHLFRSLRQPLEL